MIIKIARAEGQPNHNLVTSVDNQPRYIITSRLPQLAVSDLDGGVILSVSVDAAKRVSSIIFPKWLFDGESKPNIRDKNGSGVGGLYRYSRFMKNKTVVEYGGAKLDCYAQSYGITRNTFIHKDGTQIAEVIQPLSRTNGNWFFVFLPDKYANFEQAIYLAVARENIFPSNGISGMGQQGVATEKTWSGYSKLHDRDWISKNFAAEDIATVDSEIQAHRELAQKRR